MQRFSGAMIAAVCLAIAGPAAAQTVGLTSGTEPVFSTHRIELETGDTELVANFGPAWGLALAPSGEYFAATFQGTARRGSGPSTR